MSIRKAILLIAPFFIASCATPWSDKVPTDTSAALSGIRLTLAEKAALSDEDLLLLDDVPSNLELVGSADCSINDSEEERHDSILLDQQETGASDVSFHAKWGLPEYSRTGDTARLLFQDGYIIGHSDHYRVPLYATYALRRADIVDATEKKCFRPDVRLSDAPDPLPHAVLNDYEEAIYDRGHLVPRADMGRTSEVTVNTYVLSNMMPQTNPFNRQTWKFFEALIRSYPKFAASDRTFHIITGPVFNFDNDMNADPVDQTTRVFRKEVALPSHFFKIISEESDSGFVNTMAFLLPHSPVNQVRGMSKEERIAFYAEYLVSVDCIEAITGLNFFPDMGLAKQNAMESNILDHVWDDENENGPVHTCSEIQELFNPSADGFFPDGFNPFVN